MPGTDESASDTTHDRGAAAVDLGIRPMTEHDVDEVAAVQARAFADDPLHAWAVPDAAGRADLLTRMFAVQTRVTTVAAGTAYTDATRSVGCFWCAPRRWLPSPEEKAALAPLREILGDSGARYAVALRTLKAAHPAAPHWYLQGLGTDPARQGRGLGGAVLGPVLARCDAERLPAYLETCKERNVGFYERFDFRVLATLQIPDGGPVMWGMWREPRK